MVSMSWNFGGGLDAVGASIGPAIARPLVVARYRRRAQEASGYLEAGEQLRFPVAKCTGGGLVPRLLGPAIVCAAWGVALAVADAQPALAGYLIWGGAAAGLLLIWLAVRRTHPYALALTDRRLIIFRRASASGRRIPARHIRDVVIAVPRSEVSTDFNNLHGWRRLSLNFAPATEQAPIQLDFSSLNTLIAEAIDQALATSAARGPESATLPAGQ